MTNDAVAKITGSKTGDGVGVCVVRVRSLVFRRRRRRNCRAHDADAISVRPVTAKEPASDIRT